MRKNVKINTLMMLTQMPYRVVFSYNTVMHQFGGIYHRSSDVTITIFSSTTWYY